MFFDNEFKKMAKSIFLDFSEMIEMAICHFLENEIEQQIPDFDFEKNDLETYLFDESVFYNTMINGINDHTIHHQEM